VVWGVPVPPIGEIAGNIGRSTVNRKKMAVVGEARGKPAVTRYSVARKFDDHAALLDCRLLTGRTHQIRVHLAHIGHPLIGDPAYGTRAGRGLARSGSPGAEIAGFPRQALHAKRLGFTHPATGERLQFDSRLPPDMAALIASLELL
jgi:23S rRNA pseudouridine1911/1915/1917 synthase